METRFVHRISCTRILARRLRQIPLRVGVSPVIALRKRGKRALGNAAVARVPQRGACCSIGHRSHASENLGFGQSPRSGQPPREAQRPSNIVSGAPSPIAPTLRLRRKRPCHTGYRVSLGLAHDVPNTAAHNTRTPRKPEALKGCLDFWPLASASGLWLLASGDFRLLVISGFCFRLLASLTSPTPRLPAFRPRAKRASPHLPPPPPHLLTWF